MSGLRPPWRWGHPPNCERVPPLVQVRDAKGIVHQAPGHVRRRDARRHDAPVRRRRGGGVQAAAHPGAARLDPAAAAALEAKRGAGGHRLRHAARAHLTG
eukprot:scaffold9569_cov142-Isochrysis_galbana.AAC.8